MIKNFKQGFTPTPKNSITPSVSKKENLIIMFINFSRARLFFQKRRRNTMIFLVSGFTLIESIVFIAIFTMAITAVSGFLIYFYRGNTYVIQQAFAIESARKGIELMTREIREATFSDVGTYPVINPQDQSFAFYSDVDRDNKIEKIRYFLEDTNFKRGEIEAVGDPLIYRSVDEIIVIVSDYVRNDTEEVFTYFNASSTEITDLSQLTDIRLVKTNLVVNIEPNREPGEFTLRSSAQLRNLYGD